MSDSKPKESILGRTLVRCVSKPIKKQSFIVDFISHKIKPTHYKTNNLQFDINLDVNNSGFFVRNCK